MIKIRRHGIEGRHAVKKKDYRKKSARKKSIKGIAIVSKSKGNGKEISKTIKVHGKLITFRIKNDRLMNEGALAELHKELRGLLITQANSHLGKIFSLEFGDLYNYHLEALYRSILKYKPSDKDKDATKAESFIPYYLKVYRNSVMDLARQYNKTRTTTYYKETNREETANTIFGLVSGEQVYSVDEYLDSTNQESSSYQEGSLGGDIYELNDDGRLIRNTYEPIKAKEGIRTVIATSIVMPE